MKLYVRKFSKCLAVFLLVTIFLMISVAKSIYAAENFPYQSFSDVASNAWYYNFVEFLSANEIVNGYKGTDTFMPNNKINRQETAKMIAAGAGLIYEGLHSTFDDVADDHWADGYIAALQNAGAVSGFKGTNNFKPRDYIKRSHVSKMVVLAFNLEEGNLEVNLTDIEGVDCETYIRILASNGIVGGYKGTTEFKPNNEITRAEVSKIISLAMEPSISNPEGGGGDEPDPDDAVQWYCFNINSLKFHRLTCPSVDRMLEKNKKFMFTTSSRAVALGYDPCKVCKP